VGGLWSLFAAALDGRVAAVAAQDALFSYTALLNHGVRYPASVYLFNVLKHLDLAQVIAACAPRPVYIHPVDGLRRACSEGEVSIAFKPAREAFSLSRAKANFFQVGAAKNGQNIPKWLDEVLNR
jgi:hypothetical protein